MYDIYSVVKDFHFIQRQQEIQQHQIDLYGAGLDSSVALFDECPLHILNKYIRLLGYYIYPSWFIDVCLLSLDLLQKSVCAGFSMADKDSLDWCCGWLR